jgi:phosphoserine aminotransferase
MSRIYNFNPGPATLPLTVLEKASAELVDYQGKGMSIVEMSHRSPEYSQVHQEAMQLFRKLQGIPDNFKVLFLGGGATLQFSMVPLNLLHSSKKSCDLVLSGTWAKKAYADAKKVGKVNLVYDGESDNYASLPDPGELKLDPSAAYLHMTSNETIGGIQWHDWPDTGGVPIACDMSSDILSRDLPLQKFGIIYAGAQKNLGPSGVCVVAIREDVLDRCDENLPAYLSYRTHAKKDSLYNTPPVFAVYLMKLVLEWVDENGGLQAAGKWADERSGLLYDAIEKSGGFYKSPVPKKNRSKMNIVFRLPTEDLEKQFIADAAKEGMGGLKGHRSVGGCRASMYNAMPIEGAQALSGFMQNFASKNG